MKYYHSYMDRQEISPAAHETLMNLVAPVRRSRPWVRTGALAACAALMIGAGVWRLAPAPAQEPGPAQTTGRRWGQSRGVAAKGLLCGEQPRGRR